MRYFNYLSHGDRKSLFFREPAPFDKTTEREMLRSAVGGLLYIPGGNPTIAQILQTGKVQGLASMAICLEDAVGDQEREEAVLNVEKQLSDIRRALLGGSLSRDRLPLLFVRVKDVDMLERLAGFFVENSPVLTGVILPKTTRESLQRALSIVETINQEAKEPFYIMPILESVELMLCDDRISLLRELASIAEPFFDRILNIRIGATDLCGLYGIRRNVDTPIYQVATVASCIADIVRVFGLGDRYTISGPVWEYYSTIARARALQNWSEVEGLMQEVALDQQNGICGKTCVHPTQLLPVQASYAVPYERYHDAVAILGGDPGRVGVMPSIRHNKMNELKPHALWANKMLRQAELYGVYQENTDAKGLLRAVYNEGDYL